MGTQNLKKVPMGTRVPKWGPIWEQCISRGLTTFLWEAIKMEIWGCIKIRSKIMTELMEAALTQVICKQAPLLSNPVNIFNLSI